MVKRILIVDDDPWIRRLVRTVMGCRGYRVDSASDGQIGLDTALQIKPDLVITDVLMPKMDGWKLVRALRANPAMALVPVVFLTALNREEDRILGFRLGADDYLAKPFRFEELSVRVERVMQAAGRMQQAVQQQREEEGLPGFRGELAHLGVSAVLSILELERKSGQLRLHGRGRTGHVFVRDGQVLAASFDEQPSKTGAEAVYEMLTWTEGQFQFTSSKVEIEDQVGTSTTHLLMEGARRLDEQGAGIPANGAP